MKRLCTWAWPDPLAVSKRVNSANFGSGYWKQKHSRRQREAIARQVAQQISRATVAVLLQPADASEEAPPAPVVH